MTSSRAAASAQDYSARERDDTFTGVRQRARREFRFGPKPKAAYGNSLVCRQNVHRRVQSLRGALLETHAARGLSTDRTRRSRAVGIALGDFAVKAKFSGAPFKTEVDTGKALSY